ncbi:MAG: hypothetical protein JOS17DRAFT_842962 [Linnemannia elongata]|nr:MAG: hypothetical protein JOS17DRAFT_842962 [Linnemannia elongata]
MNRQADPADPPGLFVVLETLKSYDFSIWSFLRDLFNSVNPTITKQTALFYHYNGHVKLLELWSDKLRKQATREKLVSSALEVVVREIDKEFKRLGRVPSLKHQSTTFTRQHIEHFSMRAIDAEFRQCSPLLAHLLDSLIYRPPRKRPKPSNSNGNNDVNIDNSNSSDSDNDSSDSDNDNSISDNDSEGDIHNNTDLSTNAHFSRTTSVLVPTIGSILLYNKNRASNYLQMVTGVHLFGCGCQTQIMQFLTKTKLSVSPSTISRTLENLSKDAITLAKIAAGKGPIILVWDNVNMSFRKADQRTNNSDSFQSGTAGTLIIGAPLGKIISLQDAYNMLTTSDLTPNNDDFIYFDQVARYHLIDALRRRHDKFQPCSNPAPVLDPLPVVKTETYPLPAMHIDQSSVEGNKAVLDELLKVLELTNEYFQEEVTILLGGDQLTVSRNRSAIRQLRSATTATKRLEWALPIIQPFHIQMTLASTNFRTHYGSPGIGGSLGDAISVLRRKRLSKDNPNFHALDELIRHLFDAVALRAWHAVLKTDNIDSAADGLDNNALSILGTTTVDRILDQFLSSDQQHSGNETRPLADMASKNAALFLRDAIVFLELGAAIKAGDIGRLERVLKWITVMFQAGLTKNYAYELLHLQVGLVHAWPPQAKRAILSSILVNTTGKKNRFLATDMYQEHCNLAIKHIYAAKEGNLAWETLAEKISTIIELFPVLRAKFREVFGLKHNNTKHSTVDSSNDMKDLTARLEDQAVFNWDPIRQVGRPPREVVAAVDLLDRGMTNLQSNGRLDSFRSAFRRRVRRSKHGDERQPNGDVDKGSDPDEDVEIMEAFEELREGQARQWSRLL